jgi:hypothetical protein
MGMRVRIGACRDRADGDSLTPWAVGRVVLSGNVYEGLIRLGGSQATSVEGHRHRERPACHVAQLRP